jgi:hypothetical protein
MYILGEYYSDLALNKICFWHFITMSQSTKRRWNSGPSTPSSTSKKKKYNCKFQGEWKKSHYWLQSSSLGNDLAFCTLCSFNFSVASGGLYDIKRHSETSLHKKAVTATNKTPQLHQFMPTKSVDDQVTRAETLFSNFVAEHNSCNDCQAINRRVNNKFVYNECVFIYHFTSLLYYHSTTRYNFVRL